MTVRPKLAAIFLTAVLWLLAGCGGGEKLPFSAETDEPGYRSGQQLVKQGRDAEALSAFLKVIAKRGEQSAPESHLEAGLIYLRHIKDPLEAIHHFRKYLELQPNAKQAPNVRGLVDTARREYARTLPAHPMESQMVGLDQLEQIRQLQREVDDLRAENTALRSLAPAPLTRASRVTIDAGDSTLSAPPASSRTPAISFSPSQSAAPPAAPAGEVTPIMSPPPKPALFAPQSGVRASAPPAGRTSAQPATGGKRYTVARGDTLYAIARKFGVKVEDIAAANREAIPSVNTPLRTGAELRIP